jgi:UDP-glucose 4-epimerase
VIFAGSATVYRSDEDKPRHESDTTFPRSLYSIAKLTAEDYCTAFHQVYGLDTVRLRYFNVFGPRLISGNIHSETVAYLLQTMRSGLRPMIRGDGRQKRDFTHVNDIVQANLLAADAPRVAGKVYNIGTGQATSLLELVALLNHFLGSDLQVVQDRASEESPRFLYADIVQAQTELGYCPCTDLYQDLKDCLGNDRDVSASHSSQMRWDRRQGLIPRTPADKAKEFASNHSSSKESASRLSI